MRKITFIGLALVAVGAFFALATTSAFAALEYVLAEWLNNGNSILGSVAVDGLGEVLWENTSNKADILCSGLGVGTVWEGGEDTVTEVYNLAGTKIAELDAGRSSVPSMNYA